MYHILDSSEKSRPQYQYCGGGPDTLLRDTLRASIMVKKTSVLIQKSPTTALGGIFCYISQNWTTFRATSL